MLKNFFSNCFKRLYKHIRNKEYRRILRRGISFCDGGQFFSNNLRKVMSECENREIGIGTYGAVFDVSRTTPNISVGKYCSIAPNASFYTRDHPQKFVSTHPMFYNSQLKIVEKDLIPYGELEIGNDVWVGQNAVILPSCHKIGTGAIVGAGAIVTKDIPEYAVVVGNPAKVIKYRFSDNVIQELLESKWWDWEIEEIKEYKDYFTDVDKFTQLIRNNEISIKRGQVEKIK